jgi:hypothetical protein
VPLIGQKGATDYYAELKEAGWPVTDGRPSSPEFSDLVSNNRCGSSYSFVRSDADRGWGIICVDAPKDVVDKVRDLFDEILAITGPLYLSSPSGDVLIFGFGWPDDTSQRFEETLDLGGEHLVPS